MTKKIKNESVKPTFNSAIKTNLVNLPVNKKTNFETSDENGQSNVTTYSDSSHVQNVQNKETLIENSTASNDAYDDSIDFDDNMDVDVKSNKNDNKIYHDVFFFFKFV